jgi:hypothetical protein
VSFHQFLLSCRQLKEKKKKKKDFTNQFNKRTTQQKSKETTKPTHLIISNIFHNNFSEPVKSTFHSPTMTEICPVCGVFETANADELATHVDRCLNEQDERMARELAAQESKAAAGAVGGEFWMKSDIFEFC